MRGKDGPVKSTSSSPILREGSDARRDKASCTDTDDLPTPPLPDRTSKRCEIEESLRRRVASGEGAKGVVIWTDYTV